VLSDSFFLFISQIVLPIVVRVIGISGKYFPVDMAILGKEFVFQYESGFTVPADTYFFPASWAIVADSAVFDIFNIEQTATADITGRM